MIAPEADPNPGKLTVEQAEILSQKTTENIVNKIAAGGIPSAREMQLLRSAVAEAPEPPKAVWPKPKKGAENFAPSWDALAAALSIEERTLFDFRKRHAPRIKALGKNLTRADGRHVVAGWREFADEVGELRGRGVNNPDADYVDERALRLRERVLLVEKAEHKLARERGDVLPLAEYQDALRIMIGAFDAALKQIPGRAVEKLVAAMRAAMVAIVRGALTEKQFAKSEAALEKAPVDHTALTAILDEEIEAVRRTLAEAQFLESAEIAK